MKKIVGIILCLAVVIAAASYLLSPGKEEAGSYARFLPPDTMITVNLTHGKTLIDNFAASQLGKALAKDTVHAIISEMDGKPEYLTEYDTVYDSVVKVANDPAFRAVFGDDVTLAVLPVDHTVLAGNPEAAAVSSLVVIAQTSISGALDMLTKFVNNDRISRETVDGLDLVKIATDQGAVIYGYTHGRTVFLALSPVAIKACLAAGTGQTALDKAPAFQEAAAYWQTFPEATTYGRAYVNTPAIAELIKRISVADVANIPEGNEDVLAAFKEIGDMLAGIGAIYSVNYWTDQGVEERARVGLVYDQLHPMMKNLFDATAKGNQTMHLLRENTLAYVWASALNMEYIIQSMKADETTYQRMESGLQENVGVSMEELGRTFGPQYGGVLDDIIQTPLFPWPKMTWFVEIRDRAIAGKILDKVRSAVAAQGMANEEQEQVQDQIIHSWPILPDEALQPAVLLTENMLYLSTSKQNLKEMLAAKGTPADLTARMGRDLSGRMQAANYGNFVIFPARMAPQIDASLAWLAHTMQMRLSKKVKMERLRHELMQLLQAVELAASTTVVTKERIEVATTIVTAKKKPEADAGKQ